MSIKTMSMAIKFGRVETHSEEFPSIKPPDPLVT